MHRIEHNVETNEIIEIELTEAEIEQREAEHLAAQTKLNEAKAELNAKREAKIATLTKLGLTEEEAKLLLS